MVRIALPAVVAREHNEGVVRLPAWGVRAPIGFKTSSPSSMRRTQCLRNWPSWVTQRLLPDEMWRRWRDRGYRASVAALRRVPTGGSQVGQPVCWAPQPARATLEDVLVDLGRADIAVGEQFLLRLPGMTALPGKTVRSGFGSPSSVRPYLVETWPLPSTRHRARHNDPLTSGAVSAPASAPAARCRPGPPAS
jgi:hypothetical protein